MPFIFILNPIIDFSSPLSISWVSKEEKSSNDFSSFIILFL
jgi:hypothetical protein